MKLSDLTSMSVRSLWRRKARTFLTILGVVIGSSSIVLMVSIGLGQERIFNERLEAFGNIKVISVESVGRWNDSGGASKGTPPKLDDSTLKTIESIKGVFAVMPVLDINMNLKVGRYEGHINASAVDLSLLEKFGYKVEKGEIPTLEDRNTLLVGHSFSSQFYNPKARNWEPAEFNPLESRFKAYVNNKYDKNGNPKKPVYTTVKGILKSSGGSDYMVFINKEQGLRLLEDDQRKYPTQDGKKKLKELTYNRMMVLCKDINDVEKVHEELKQMNFNANSPIEYVKHEKENLKTQKMVLGGIGAVSFLVAAIGIMNTMIMAIYERTREIGVMKVLGAELRDIMRLFLLEAAIIGFLGGVVGLALSSGGSQLINHFYALAQADAAELGFSAPLTSGISYIPLWLAFVSILFSSIVGIVAGLLPAFRATKLSALEAIKNE